MERVTGSADSAVDVTPVRFAGSPVVVFDGVCNLCNRAVQFVLDHDRQRRILLCASQSEAGARLLAGRTGGASPGDTIFFVEEGRLHDRSTAALRIARALGLPWSLLYAFILVPRPLRDWVYGIVAKNRYRWFGRRESCRVPRPGELERFLT